MDVEDEASRCAMEVADEIKVEGTETMLTAISDPPETGGVEAMRTGSGFGSGHTDKGNRQRSHYAEGFGKAGKGSAFVTSEPNSMKHTTPKSDEVWYVDSGASNHMTSHKGWFSYLEKPMQPGVVVTGDDTLHPITNVGEVPLSHVGQKGKLMNMLHVPTITKNLVLVG